MIFDRWASLAVTRNRAESVQLKKQLDHLEKQKYKEIIILKNKKNDYRKRCLINLSSKDFGSQDDLLSFENLHIKGADDRSASRSNISCDYNSLHRMVFTKDTVDIEKLLILHLISVHKSETLTPSRHKLSTVLKENDPTARLIEKSRRPFYIDETIMDLIPFYTIEMCEYGPNGEKRRPILNKDKRLANRVLFNRNIRKLVITVFSALHKSNFLKFKKLIQLAQDPESIKNMLTKPKSTKFIEAIGDQLLITSTENFTLTPPFKLKTRDLNIRTASGSLENVIKNLRTRVLQIPLPLYHQTDSKGDFQKTAMARRYTATSYANPFKIDDFVSLAADKYARPPLKLKLSKMYKEDKKDDDNKAYLQKSIPNFVKKNIELAGKAKRIEYDVERDIIKLPNRRESKRISMIGAHAFRERKNSNVGATYIGYRAMPISPEEPEQPEAEVGLTDILKNVPRQSVTSVIEHAAAVAIETHHTLYAHHTDKEHKIEHLQDTAKRRRFSEQSDTRSHRRSGEQVRHNHPIDPDRRGSRQYSIYQTTCPACMERWRNPLPTPKSPRLHVEKDPLKTDSKQKIDKLIDKELFTLETYDKKFLERSSGSKSKDKSQEYEDFSIDPIQLAIIEQEIRQKETHKKVEKFIKENS